MTVGLALFRYRQLRTVSNYLIGNLALSDFLLATTIFPLSTVKESLGYWPFGGALCHIWLTLDVLYCTASIWNLCVIAFDRFTATVFPVWYRGRRSAPGRQAAVYASVVWSVAAIVCVPPVLGWNAGELHVFDDETGVASCNLFETQGYVIYSASGSFFVPLLVTIFFYSVVLGVLWTRMRGVAKRRRHDGAPNNTSVRESSSRVGGVKSAASRSALTVTRIELSLFSGSCLSIADIGSAPPANDKYDDSESRRSSIDSFCAGASTGAADGVKPAVAPTQPKSTLGLPVNGAARLSVPTIAFHAPAAATDNKQQTTFGIHTSSSFCLSPFMRRKNQIPTSNSIEIGATAAAAAPSAAELAAKLRRQRASYERRELRATVRMAIIIAFFCGFWLGFFVVYVVRGCCADCPIPRALDAFFFWLGYSNSAVNPILYTIFNDEFRTAFRKIIGVRKKSKTDSSKPAKATNNGNGAR